MSDRRKDESAEAIASTTPGQGLQEVFARGPSLAVAPSFAKAFASEETFAKTRLAGRVAPFPSRSTSALARTRHPMVLVRVTDDEGTPLPGVRLELFDDGGLFLDAVESDSIGLGLLRWPAQPPTAESPKLKGKVHAGATRKVDVLVPAGEEFVVVPVELQAGAPFPPEDAPAHPHDSVVPRLPGFFSVVAADEILRHRATGDGPDPCFHDAIGRQCTYRAPRVRWIYVRRTVYQGLRPPRRLYVRVRQEWHFVGHSFGQPERIDSRDVASLVGSLDASLDARVAVSGRLDLSTASVLSMDASGRLRAAASLDGELDASVGLHLFEGGLGNPLSVSGDAHVSIDTSLLVSAQLKMRASLRNQLHARASLSGRAGLGLQADASISVNPTLSRELNMPRFVIHQNYVVTSFVEDVQEIEEIEMFDELKEETIEIPPALPGLPDIPFNIPLFPPSDVVEYRPIFEPQLLETALAGRFRTLRKALDSATGRGPVVRRLRFDVTYSATSSGWFHVQVGDRHGKAFLRAGQSVTRVTIDLPGGEYLGDLDGESVALYVTLFSPSPEWLSALAPVLGSGSPPPTGLLPWATGSITIQQVGISSEVSSDRQRESFGSDPFEANAAKATDTRIVHLQLPAPDTRLLDDPLVVHVNRNPTYYMGLLVKAALANPSLRFDVSQLKRIGPDNVLWRLPIHGFAGNKALVMVPATGEDVETLLQDLGRATVVQIAVDGNWTEAMQGHSVVDDAVGALFPGLENLTLPLALMEGLQEGGGLLSSIVEGAGQAAGLGGAAGAIPLAGAAGVTSMVEALDL